MNTYELLELKINRLVSNESFWDKFNQHFALRYKTNEYDVKIKNLDDKISYMEEKNRDYHFYIENRINEISNKLHEDMNEKLNNLYHKLFAMMKKYLESYQKQN